MKRKTIIFVCNNKGGIGKSTTAACVGDALQKLGYTVLYLSGDQTTNIVLKNLHPTTHHFYIREIDEVDEAMKLAMSATEDVIIFDLPGDSSRDAAAYFNQQDFKVFREAGLRFVLAVAAVQHKDSIVGGIQWVETFLDNADIILFANGSRTPEGETIDLTKVDGGSDLIELADNRIVEVPGFNKEMLKQYLKNPAVPSAYFGELGKKLGMDMMKMARWRRLHNRVMESVSNHAEWLTGKPIPKPLGLEDVSGSPKPNSTLDRLKLTYGDAFSRNESPLVSNTSKKPKVSESA